MNLCASLVCCVTVMSTLGSVDVPSSCTSASDEKAKASDQTLKILAKSPWESKQLAPRTGFIRGADGAALFLGAPAGKENDEVIQKESTAKLAKRFSKDTIDWSKQMILFVEAGERKTGGYSVEITGLEVKDKKLIVKWKLIEPKPDDLVTQLISHPAAALLVERFDGEISFDPDVKK